MTIADAVKTIREWHGCKRKIKSSKDGAKRRAKKQRQKGNLKYKHYKCDYCDGWHISSGTGKRELVLPERKR